jgi:FkbM family methyltransferase
MNLLESQQALLGTDGPRVIYDVGVQDGRSTIEYVETFPNAKIFAFEPDDANYTTSIVALQPHQNRVVLNQLAISKDSGSSPFFVNTHSGTHSLLPIGGQRYWDGRESTVATRAVQTITLDDFSEANDVSVIDILKMDIQGAELDALTGASRLLTAGNIRLITLEVEFQELYRAQPLFWDIGAFLRRFGYGLYALYDCHFSPKNANTLCWADAIFLSPKLLEVEEW